MWPQSDNGVSSIIAVAKVPENVNLPAKVRIPLPAGAQLTWAGQIVGTDTSGDIAEQPTTGTANGGEYVELTASKSRMVQYEAAIGVPKVQGNAHSSVLTWRQTTFATQVRFAVRLPLAATNVAIKPAPEGDPVKNEQLAQMLYGLPPVNLKPGSTYVLDVSYDLAPGAATGGSATGGSTTGAGVTGAPAANNTPLLMFVFVIAVIILASLAIMMTRRGRSAPDASGDDDEDADESASDGNDDEDAGDDAEDAGDDADEASAGDDEAAPSENDATKESDAFDDADEEDAAARSDDSIPPPPPPAPKR
jgi:hypothetical protein